MIFRYKMYHFSVHFDGSLKKEKTMTEMTVNQFRANLKSAVESALSTHEPLRVKRRAGQDFVVISADLFE